ncbi:hypothetical protein [Candidatus Methanocrinis natronophilus]|uniref:Uncharacterized protein n=1 Tax=Candidatus Methanocrinis natronophilus TaxID=3033396 RepID=A0ABT5X7K3_9EURY|nr:hypothetical protein [Candidatus Methanocrinis natronophilus]MDF0590671.1 hypothetical protein [Candidatus Methanocrinis natronophilus]
MRRLKKAEDVEEPPAINRRKFDYNLAGAQKPAIYQLGEGGGGIISH